MSEFAASTPAQQKPSQQRRKPVRSAFRRSWRLVRGERRGPVSRVLGRSVTLRLGSRRRQTTLGAVTAVVLVLVFALGSVVVFATPLLGARSIQVMGAKELTASKVRRAAGIDVGSPLALLDIGEIEARVSALPEVAKVAVVRAWPAAVQIKVTERQPAAAAELGGKFVVIDTLGVPYLITKERPAKLPFISGTDENRLAIPNFASDPKPNNALVAAVRVARTLTPELSEKLVHIEAPDQRRISLKLTGGRSVFWGAAVDPMENIRKATVATVLLGRSGKVMDVSTPGVVSVH